MDDEKLVPPKVDNAPGIVWKRRKETWVAIWQPRTDLVGRGYPCMIHNVWRGVELSELDHKYISDQCVRLQETMLTWGRGGISVDMAANLYDGTLNSLIECYQTDPDSSFKKTQFKTREYYTSLLKRLIIDHGHEKVADIKARNLLRWHEDLLPRGTAMARGVMRMLRSLFSFGATMLEDQQCDRLCSVMSKMRFKMAPKRTTWVTVTQAVAVRKTANEWGLQSIALGQAFQFEVILRQKDVIGEWVPFAEPGVSDVTAGGRKWIKGIRWEEIDEALILRHTTSKRQKDIEVDLKLAPMVIEELERAYPGLIVVNDVTKLVTVNRSLLPVSGPVIISEFTGRPWRTQEFRRRWRKVATASGVPKNVWNMDSRSGGITEANDAGVPIEHISKAATHSQISQTMDYNRNQRGKSDNVMTLRATHRKNASKT